MSNKNNVSKKGTTGLNDSKPGNNSNKNKIIFAMLGKGIYITMVLLIAFHMFEHYRQADEEYSMVHYISVTIFVVVGSLLYYITSIEAQKDSMTGWMSKDQLVSKLVMISIRGKLTDYAGVFVNIKDFKYINQTVGLDGGDWVIKFYCEAIEKYIIKGEYVARLGGDNFMVVLYKHRTDGFMELLDNMEFYIDTPNGEQKVRVDSRCGIYAMRPKDSIGELFNNSSFAMNYGKITKEADYVIYREELHERVNRENEVAYRFSEALKGEEFRIVYQPKVNAVTRHLVGFEALVRWEDKDKSFLLSDFIPVLEKRNIISELDFYVLEHVCQDICKWKEMGLPVVPVSSNFSKLNLKNKHFVNDFIEVLDRYGIEHDRIGVEFTESNEYKDIAAMRKFTEDMSNLRISTAIDDFGSGYSSLELLKMPGTNVVKLNRSFIAGIEENDGRNSNAVLLRNVIRMCHDMKKTVICQGVENKEQERILCAMNCTVLQGFLYDRPLEEPEAELRLANPIYLNED